MDTTEVEMRDKQRNRMAQIFEFLGITQSQAREPAIEQAH
jgi:hypothetical protein